MAGTGAAQTSCASESMLLMVLQLLKKDPKERLELRQLLQHPWIVGNADTSTL